MRIRILFATAVLGAACRVYNPDLLGRRDGVVDGDAAEDTGIGDADDVATDMPGDTMPDSGASCATLVAMRMPCIEPVTGHAFSADDPRLIAPRAVTASAAPASRIVVGDPGSGRVMSYDAMGMAPMRVAGTGVIGLPTGSGPATMNAIGSPSALLYLPSGDLLVADSSVHAILRVRPTGAMERFGTFSFSDGPWALALPDPATLVVAADNQVFSITLTGSDPSTPVSIVGRACGTSCRGFNAAPAAGSLTSLNQPLGLAADANAVYIADFANCRVRRAARMDASTPFRTTVLAGAGCNRTADVMMGMPMGTVPAAAATLGPVGDVRVGGDGNVYFTDEARCAVFSIDAGGAMRLVAGNSQRCGMGGVGGVSLGQLGALGLSDDRMSLFVVDRQNARVYRIALSGGTTGMPTMVVNPGAVPGTMAGAASVRVGGVSGVAVQNPAGLDVTVYFAGALDGRTYRLQGSTVSVWAGAGSERLTVGVAASQAEPGEIAGLGYGDDRLVVGLRGHHVIASNHPMSPLSLVRLAGTYDTAGVPTLGRQAAAEELTDPSWPIMFGTNLYFSMEGAGPRVFRVNMASPTVQLQTVAGVAPGADAGMGPPDGSARATDIALGRPQGLAADPAGNIFVADSAHRVVWRVSTTGMITIAAGIYDMSTPFMDAEADANAVAFGTPVALATNGMETLYIVDEERCRVRALNLSTNRITTLAGSGATPAPMAVGTGDFGLATAATLARPRSIAFAAGRVYVGEWNSGRVRAIRLP